MRRLCFGGSFNPIHLGHLQCSAAAAKAGGFDRVVLIPAAVSPHKLNDPDTAPAADRLRICKLGAAEFATRHPEFADLFEINDLELKRPFPSYTIDTVRQLKSLGWPEVNWLIGGDQLAKLPTWHEAKSLVKEAKFWVIARPGFSFNFESLPAEFISLESRILNAPLLDISASDIRRRVREGDSVERSVTPAVWRYILRRRLYTAK